MATKLAAPGARPACDWDSASNPSFDTWSTVNLAEVFPGVAWPFDASWYHRWQTWKWADRLRHQFDIVDLLPLYEWPIPNFLGFFAGQCAANVAFSTAIVSSYQVGGGSSAVEAFFTADKPGGARAEATVDVQRAKKVRRRFFGLLGQLPAAALVNRRKTQEITEQVAALDLDALSERALRRWFERVEKMTGHMFLQHVWVSFGAGEYSSMLGELLKSGIPDLDEAAVTTLTSGLGEVESTRPMRGLWELSRQARRDKQVSTETTGMSLEDFRKRLANPASRGWQQLSAGFEAFLQEFGFRGPTEWMVALPDWREDPTFPLNSLRNMLAAPDSEGPDERHKAVTAHRAAVEAAYRDRLPASHRARYDELLSQAQKYVRLREFTKANCIRVIRPGRTLLLALGTKFQQRGAIAERDDLFYLLANEVDQVITGKMTPAEAKAAVLRRRKQKKVLEEGYVLPDNFTGQPEIVRRGAKPEPAGHVLPGLAVSPGTATGRARVVTGIDDASEVTMDPGDVLVAPFTDAPWTPLFLVASAVVVETGGLLSHAATIAREFGIPAVVMVKDATRRIKDGQSITVDGTAGRVTLN